MLEQPSYTAWGDSRSGERFQISSVFLHSAHIKSNLYIVINAVQAWFRYIFITCRKQSKFDHSDASDKEEKQENRKTFKQQSFLKKSQSSARDSARQRTVNTLAMDNTNESDDDSDDDVIIGGSRLNLRGDFKKSPLRDEGLFEVIISENLIRNNFLFKYSAAVLWNKLPQVAKIAPTVYGLSRNWFSKNALKLAFFSLVLCTYCKYAIFV